MRWMRFVFSIRLLMILVALVGVGSGIFELRLRSLEFSERADRFAILKEPIGFCNFYRPSDPVERDRVRSLQKARRRAIHDHFEQLEKKYRAAALAPWLAIEADPPEPEKG